jgi:hypothetical protein
MTQNTVTKIAGIIVCLIGIGVRYADYLVFSAIGALCGYLASMVGIYSDRARDPRGPAVSICYRAKGRGTVCAGTDAEYAIALSLGQLPKLAFDHDKMIDDYRR